MPKIKEPRKSNLGFRRVGIKVSEDYHFDPETENEPKPSMSGIHFSSGSYRLHKGFDRPNESKVYGGDYLDLEDRKQLKYLQEEKHITKGGFSVGSTGHLKDF